MGYGFSVMSNIIYYYHDKRLQRIFGMKRILVLSNSCKGLVIFRKEVFEALINDGNIVTVVAPQSNKIDISKEIGCKYLPISFNRQGTNPFADIRLMLKYRSIIKEEKPDVVLTYTIKPNLYGGMACRLTKTPQIANVTGLGIATEKPGCLYAITKVLYQLGLKKAQKVFFQNKESMDFCIKKHFVTAPSSLIPGSGVNLDRFQLQPYPDDSTCRFIFIGRIQQRKGIEQYLKAAQVIKEKYPQTEFHILGSCEDTKYQSTIDLMVSQGTIIYHGLVKDVRPFLKDMHCTVHPSFYPEGMSNVLLESCAIGRPVITTDKAGCREIVDDGQTGFIVRQQDTEDLVDKIEKFIQLPHGQKEGMGCRAHAKVEREFNRDFVIEAYLNEIREGITR